jgi:uncharacterized protein (TIGR01777 family)
MKIVIAGGSGFLGRPLADALAEQRHAVVVLTRASSATRPNGTRLVPWTPDGNSGAFAREIDGADAVVNLAGESIAGGRWTEARKRRILDSRVKATRSLTEAMAAAASPPAVFVSGSAVGDYGPRGDEPITEDAAPGSDFLARVCVHWEAEANRAASDRTRVVCLRTGVWPDRLKDAEEIDVIEQQLAGSTLVDDETRKRAIEGAHEIDEAAHQRIGSRGAERE